MTCQTIQLLSQNIVPENAVENRGFSFAKLGHASIFFFKSSSVVCGVLPRMHFCLRFFWWTCVTSQVPEVSAGLLLLPLIDFISFSIAHCALGSISATVVNFFHLKRMILSPFVKVGICFKRHNERACR